MRKMPQYKETLDVISRKTYYNSDDDRILFEGTTEMEYVSVSGNIRSSDDLPYLCLTRKVFEGNFTNTRWTLSSYEIPNPEYAVFVRLISASGAEEKYCLKYDFVNRRMLVYPSSSAVPYDNAGILFDDLTWTSYLQPAYGQFTEFKFKLNRQLVENENIVAAEFIYVKLDQFRTTLPIEFEY